jgi:hypothetical protein
MYAGNGKKGGKSEAKFILFYFFWMKFIPLTFLVDKKYDYLSFTT